MIRQNRILQAWTAKLQLMGCVACLLFASGLLATAWAEDIEIYVGGSGGADFKHNVLFILDLSDSMSSERVSAVPNSPFRIDALREVMNDLIYSLESINVGYMRMNGFANPGGNTGIGQLPSSSRSCRAFMGPSTSTELSDTLKNAIQNRGGETSGSGSGNPNISNFCVLPVGGTVLFPVADIDEPLGNIAGENRDLEIISNITEVADNVPHQQVGNAAESFVISNNEPAYLRFTDVRVPRNATILSASIDFTAASDPAAVGTSNIEVKEFKRDNVSQSDLLNPSIASFPLLGTVWSPPSAVQWVAGSTHSIDVKARVESLVSRSGWCGGNAMGFRFAPQGTSAYTRAAVGLSNNGGPSSGNTDDTPVLRINYQRGTGDCYLRSYTSRASGREDNMQSRRSNNNRALLGHDIVIGQSRGLKGGFLFEVPLDSSTVTIESAILRLTSLETSTDSTTLNVTVEDAADGDADIFVDNELYGSRYPASSASTTFNSPSVMAAEIIDIPVTNLVLQAINDSNWKPFNRMSFLVTNAKTTNDAARVIVSYSTAVSSGNLGRAPELIISYKEHDNSKGLTVRDRLLDINRTLVAENTLIWTPTVETLYEAALYWRSKEVFYGLTRGNAYLNKIRFNVQDNKIDYSAELESTLTSHPGSWDAVSGGGYQGNVDCQFSHTQGCVLDLIAAGAKYKSPFSLMSTPEALSCAKNHQILLTDGLPTSFSDAVETQIRQEFNFPIACDRSAANNKQGTNGRCAIEIAEALANNDQSSTLAGDQLVNTHTVAFGLDPSDSAQRGGIEWLQQIAAAGGGESKTANDGEALAAALQALIAEIEDRSTSFATPAVSINAFNRLYSRDEIYFGLFKPDTKPRWNGNLKKFRLCVDTTADADGDNNPDCTILGEVLDSTGKPAVDDITGQFKTSSQSLWSATADGPDILLGGAGAEFADNNIDIVGERVIYTDIGINNAPATSGSSLDDAANGYKITQGNYLDAAQVGHIHGKLCDPGIGPDQDAADGSAEKKCADIMTWFLGGGLDVGDEDEDGDVADPRWWFNDILHSSPGTVTYGQTASNEFIDKLLFGTNGGGLHMVNGANGVEEWVFIPNKHLSTNKDLYYNAGSGHPYGIDSAPIIKTIDTNQDGTIDPADSDSVNVFFGERRGGNSIYALDITPANTLTATSSRVTPKFMWSITGGTQGFSRLGQTWSEPVIGTIACVVNASGPCGIDGLIDVLVFGGGYDTDLDAGGSRRRSLGNAIYIVDANTGELIFSISDSSSDSDIKIADMQYAIASRVTLFDSDGDNIDDRIYVGDVGGQVWRIDLGTTVSPGAASSPEGNTIVGRLADIYDDSGPIPESGYRSFFYRPSVVQIVDANYANSANYDYIVIASGRRPSPSNTEIENRLYALRDFTIGRMKAQTGNPNEAKDYPISRRFRGGRLRTSTIVESDLIDVSSLTLDDPTNPVSGRSVRWRTVKRSPGWYYPFAGTGEKSLSQTTVIGGTILLSTYTPSDGPTNTVDCSIAEGSGTAYNFNLLTAAAVEETWHGDKKVLDKIGDRKQTLSAGIPSGAIAVFTKEGVAALFGQGGGAKSFGEIATIPYFPTYWEDDTSGN